MANKAELGEPPVPPTLTFLQKFSENFRNFNPEYENKKGIYMSYSVVAGESLCNTCADGSVSS